MNQTAYATEIQPLRNPSRGIHLVATPPRAVQEPPAVERRSNTRVTTNDAGMMRVLEPYSPVRWLVRVVSVSANGLRLISPTPLEPGHLVQINVKNVSLLTVVRHCSSAAEHYAEDQHQIGVEIRHVF